MENLKTNKESEKATDVDCKADHQSNSSKGTLFLIWFLFFVFSYSIIGYYDNGDQTYYRGFYNEASVTPITGLFTLMLAKLGALEPISGFLLWAGSNLGIEKDLYISIINAFFASSTYSMMRKYKAEPLDILLILLGFYTSVLFFSAERLKFAYLFLVLALLYADSMKSALFKGLALFSHFQTVLFLVSAISARISKGFIDVLTGNTKLTLGVALAFVAVLFAVSGIAIYFQSIILDKFSSYYSGGIALQEGLRIILLTALCLLLLSRPVNVLAIMLPLLIASFILGGDRVNMVAYSMALFLFLDEGKTHNILWRILAIYYVIKNIDFIHKVIQYGDGFYTVG